MESSTVIAGVNLNNLKANHNHTRPLAVGDVTVIAGVNLNNLKANHNIPALELLVHLTVIAGVLKQISTIKSKLMILATLLSLA